MANENRKVAVKSTVNYKVGLSIPELRFFREFTRDGDTKSIDFDTLYEGITSLGVRTLFEEGILYIPEKQDRVDLGLEEADEKEDKFKPLTENQILKLLRLDSPEKLEEVVNTLPLEQVNKIAETAIKEKITDYQKCSIIKKRCKIDIITMVQNEEQL